jgi:hypothetical protein
MIGLFWAAVTTRPIPRMERGAADSIIIVTILEYIQDISGESASRVSARIRRSRKQIIEVTMIFKLTLSETQGTARRVGFPFSKNASGKALSTTVMIANTEKGEPTVQ